MVEERAGFEKLDVWREARVFGKMVINVYKIFPGEEKFRLTDQVKRSSRSITANIAEGYGRFHYVDNIKFCRTARGSLNETLDHLITASDECYITEQELNLYRQQYTKVHRLLNGYISYLKAQTNIPSPIPFNYFNPMPPILLQITNNTAFITLNRPDKLNSFNREMALLLQEKLNVCSEDNSIRCIYLTGAGKGFCAGQDLVEVADPNGPGMQKILSEHYNPIISKLRSIPKPIIAAVNGVAAGAGANIALACDIVVASQNASFIQAFSKIGLIPDSGGTFHLPRLIGFQKASALMMLGDKLTADEALQSGMLYKVFGVEIFDEASKQIANILAAMPTKALGYIKHVLNQSLSNDLSAQLQLEDEYQQKAANTDDFKEGVTAFLEKRTPQFKGN